MNRRQKIIVSITGIFIILLALVGLTYAYFLTQITGNENDKSISVTTANLELVYGDGNNLVTVSNIEPGDPITPKTFTVTNNGNATVEDFNIYLEDVRNTLSRKTDLIYTITCQNTTVGATSTVCEDFEVVENEVNGTELVFPSVMSVIARDTLEPATETTNAEQHTYTLTVTYKEMNIDQSEDMNKEVSAKVNIYDKNTKFLANEIMTNAKKTGTFDYNKTAYIDPSLQDGTTYTIPAEQVNKETERIITYTFDDYGTSYYYRGNIEDNYVNFAEMCWRIVRIAGDGSVKLILEDYHTTCDNYGYKGSWDYAIGNYGYNYSNGKILANYLEPKTNADSSMVRVFYKFQTTKLTDYMAKLKSGDWCLGDTAYTRNEISPYSYSLIDKTTDRYALGTDFYYDSYVRLSGENENGYQPTLKCNGTVMNKYKTVTNNGTEIIKEAPMFVATLTADEMAYAGGKYETPNGSYYLINDFQKSEFFGFYSLSLLYYKGFGENAAEDPFSLRKDGSLDFRNIDSLGDDVNNYGGPRPVVSLNSDVIISTNSDSTTNGQPGTIDKPYVIG